MLRTAWYELYPKIYLGSVGVWAGIRLDNAERRKIPRSINLYHRQEASGGVLLVKILILYNWSTSGPEG
jgi:hypothetical protein